MFILQTKYERTHILMLSISKAGIVFIPICKIGHTKAIFFLTDIFFHKSASFWLWFGTLLSEFFFSKVTGKC